MNSKHPKTDLNEGEKTQLTALKFLTNNKKNRQHQSIIYCMSHLSWSNSVEEEERGQSNAM